MHTTSNHQEELSIQARAGLLLSKCSMLQPVVHRNWSLLEDLYLL